MIMPAWLMTGQPQSTGLLCHATESFLPDITIGTSRLRLRFTIGRTECLLAALHVGVAATAIKNGMLGQNWDHPTPLVKQFLFPLYLDGSEMVAPSTKVDNLARHPG